MTLGDSPFNWREPYIAAILEPEKDQVLPRIHVAKMVIRDHVDELAAWG